MAVRQYVGARYVPKFYQNSQNPLRSDWEGNKAYEALTIVQYNNSSYTSKIPVPAGIGNPAQNPTYWVNTGDYNAQVEQYRQQVVQTEKNLNEQITGVQDSITFATFDTVAEMKTADIKQATLLITKGYNTINDGGACTYYVTNTQPTGFYETLIDGFAVPIFNGPVNVKCFGAVGNGSNDDTDAINKAINFAISTTKNIYIPNGTYLISNTIALENVNNFNIYGDSMLSYNNANGSVLTGDIELLSLTSCTYFKIDGISFKGNGKQIGLYMKDCHNYVLKNVNCHNFSQGVVADTSGLGIIENLQSSGSQYGLYLNNSGDMSIIDCYINTNEPDGNSLDYCGLAINNGSSNVNVTGGKFEWNNIGIRIWGSQGITITGTIFDNNRVANVNIVDGPWPCTSINITSCRFLSGGYLENGASININSPSESSLGVNISNCSIKRGGAGSNDNNTTFNSNRPQQAPLNSGILAIGSPNANNKWVKITGCDLIDCADKFALNIQTGINAIISGSSINLPSNVYASNLRSDNLKWSLPAGHIDNNNYNLVETDSFYYNSFYHLKCTIECTTPATTSVTVGVISGIIKPLTSMTFYISGLTLQIQSDGNIQCYNGSVGTYYIDLTFPVNSLETVSG